MSCQGFRWYGLSVLLVCCLAVPVVAHEDADPLALPEISITAEKLDLPAFLPAAAEEIASLTLQLRYSPSPNEALRLNPSVSTPGSLKGMAAAPSIRGFSNYSNQVLMDGTPITMPWSNWANLTAFPLRNLRRVSVVKGGDSLVYGTGGLSGAINMGLPTARDLDGLRLYQEIGAQGVDHKEVFYGWSGHQNEHLFGYVGDYTRGYQRHAMKESGSMLYKGSVTTDGGWNFRVGLLELQGRFELPDVGDTTLTPQLWDRWDFSHRDLVAEKNLSDDRSLTFRVYRNAEDYTTIDFKDYTYTTRTGQSSQRMSTEGGEIIYNFSPGPRHRVAVGYQGKQERQNGSSVGTVDRLLTTNGLFVSDRVEVSSQVDLRLNARRDSHSTAGDETSWSAGVDWEPHRKWNLAVTSSRLVRFPAMRELYMTFIGRKNASGTWTASVPGSGDETNHAEVARTVDVSCAYRFHPRWSASVTRFQSKVSDLIDRVWNTKWPKESPRFWWRNRTEVDIAGWEGRLQGAFGRHWSLWSGYTRQEEADVATTNTRLDERPEYRLNTGLSWDDHRTSAMLYVERRGSTPYVALEKNVAKNMKMKSGTRFDLSVRHRLSALVTAVLAIDNLTDAELESSTHVIGAPLVLETPRRATLGLETHF